MKDSKVWLITGADSGIGLQIAKAALAAGNLEVASLVYFLVSPAAAYLTGANYLIDGGALPVV